MPRRCDPCGLRSFATVLGFIDTAALVFDDDYFDGASLAALIPYAPTPSNAFRQRELDGEARQWWDVESWRAAIERWLPYAAGRASCLDHLLWFTDNMDLEEKSKTVLRGSKRSCHQARRRCRALALAHRMGACAAVPLCLARSAKRHGSASPTSSSCTAVLLPPIWLTELLAKPAVVTAPAASSCCHPPSLLRLTETLQVTHRADLTQGKTMSGGHAAEALARRHLTHRARPDGSEHLAS